MRDPALHLKCNRNLDFAARVAALGSTEEHLQLLVIPVKLHIFI